MKNTLKIIGFAIIFSLNTIGIATASGLNPPKFIKLMELHDGVPDDIAVYLEPYIVDHSEKQRKTESLYLSLKNMVSQDNNNLTARLQSIDKELGVIDYQLDDLSKTKADMIKQKERYDHTIRRSVEKGETPNENTSNLLDQLNEEIDNIETREHYLHDSISKKQHNVVKIKKQMGALSQKKDMKIADKLKDQYMSLMKETNNSAQFINNTLTKYKIKHSD